MLSTDKAAYPINAMGMTKALAEKIAFAEAFNDSQSDTVINVTLRKCDGFKGFGNPFIC